MNFFSNIAFSITRKQTKRYLQKSGGLARYEKALNSILDTNLRQSLERYGYSKDAGSCSFSIRFVEDILQKLNLCKDTKIKTKAIETIVSAGDKSRKELNEAVHRADGLLDSENVIEGLYSRLYSQSSRYKNEYLYAKGLVAKYKDAVESGFVEDAESTLSDLLYCYSEPRAFFGQKKLNFLKKNWSKRHDIKTDINTEIASNIKDLWQDTSRFSSLREYIQYHPEDKETAQYLWETKYLPFIKNQNIKGNTDESDTIIKLMKEINDQFGTKIFIDEKESEITKKALEFIKKEFSMWKEAGKGQEKFPLLLNITEFNKMFTQTTDGFCNYEKTALYLRKYRMHALRHEMGHLNIDKKSLPPDEVKGWMIDEYKNAGICDDMITYAVCKGGEEPFAVYLEGNMSKYSERMHNCMGKSKRHKFIRNLPYHSF